MKDDRTPTVTGAAKQIREGRLSCRELLERCLGRIDRHEAQVRAWVLVDRDRARAEADLRDRELKGGLDRGPLHGVPVAIKDIFDVFDWPTACGSRRRSSRPASEGWTSSRRGVPSCRDVTATTWAPGWRSRILISSSAV